MARLGISADYKRAFRHCKAPGGFDVSKNTGREGLESLCGNAKLFVGHGFTGYGKTQSDVIPFTENVLGEPRRAARRGISLFLGTKQRGIPRCARNDNRGHFSATCLAADVLDF
jgi:hypothetical protein